MSVLLWAGVVVLVGLAGIFAGICLIAIYGVCRADDFHDPWCRW